MQGAGLIAGAVFAGYRIERVLGRGGMGTVYLAAHPRLPRLIALKLLSRDLYADEDVRLRFEREADVAARLDHPNIVSVLDRGAEDGQLWISMQYVDGSDAAAFGAAPPDPLRAARIIGQTAEALDYAHERGVLHRDVKPANILLTSGRGGDRVLLSDFGIARLRDDQHQLTKTGEFLATLAYASPEQLSGRPVDHRADQYALGCTLYALLTGAAPFAATNPGAVVAAHLSLPVPRASAAVPRLPEAIDAVIARSMAKNPDERFGSCSEFADTAYSALTRRPPVANVNLAAAVPPNAVPEHSPSYPAIARTSVLPPASAEIAASGPTVRSPGPGQPGRVDATRLENSWQAAPHGHGLAGVGGPAAGYPVPHPAPVSRQRQVSSGWRTASVLLIVLALLAVAGAGAVYWKFLRPPGPKPVPWGAHHPIAVNFPGLIPADPAGTGWRGARCSAAGTVVAQAGDPIPVRQIICTDPDGVTAWYTEYSSRDDVEKYLTAHTTRVGERDFSEFGVLVLHRPTDPAAPFSLATHGWVTPGLDNKLVEVSWPGHSFDEVRDQWWQPAPF
ncbi:protein kinase [Nocardia sp. NPDC050710]|uniref:protein kinase domain-containing protein n=1 Tax=Nocardia sp. NPDC050710 TaxID=3157220 RepID=UPI0033F2F6CF